MSRVVTLTLILLLASGASHAADWRVEKCTRYQRAWTDALRRLGTKGLSAEFMLSHKAFIASGCLENRNVCPRSQEELALANIMVISAMNFGTASTFPPFACPR